MPENGLTYNRNYPTALTPWSAFPAVFPDSVWGSVAAYAIYRKPANAATIISGCFAYIMLAWIGITPGREKSAKQLYQSQFASKINAQSSKRLVRKPPAGAAGEHIKIPVWG